MSVSAKLREMVGRATKGPWHWDCDKIKGDPLNRTRFRITTIGKTITQFYYNSDDPCVAVDTELVCYLVNNAEKLAALIEAAEELRWVPQMTSGSEHAETFTKFCNAVDALATIEEGER